MYSIILHFGQVYFNLKMLKQLTLKLKVPDSFVLFVFFFKLWIQFKKKIPILVKWPIWKPTWKIIFVPKNKYAESTQNQIVTIELWEGFSICKTNLKIKTVCKVSHLAIITLKVTLHDQKTKMAQFRWEITSTVSLSWHGVWQKPQNASAWHRLKGLSCFQSSSQLD